MRESVNAASESRPETFLRLNAVVARTALSKSEIYRMMGEGSFPQNIHLGVRSVVWRESEINTWIHELVRRQRGAS